MTQNNKKDIKFKALFQKTEKLRIVRNSRVYYVPGRRNQSFRKSFGGRFCIYNLWFWTMKIFDPTPWRPIMEARVIPQGWIFFLAGMHCNSEILFTFRKFSLIWKFLMRIEFSSLNLNWIISFFNNKLKQCSKSPQFRR